MSVVSRTHFFPTEEDAKEATRHGCSGRQLSQDSSSLVEAVSGKYSAGLLNLHNV